MAYLCSSHCMFGCHIAHSCIGVCTVQHHRLRCSNMGCKCFQSHNTLHCTTSYTAKQSARSQGLQDCMHCTRWRLSQALLSQHHIEHIALLLGLTSTPHSLGIECILRSQYSLQMCPWGTQYIQGLTTWPPTH